MTHVKKPLACKQQQILLYEIHLRLQNGATLTTTLQDLAIQEGKKIGKRLNNILLAIKNGEPLSQALRNENMFLIEVVNLIEAGEKTHRLHQAIALSDSLLNQLEKRAEMLRRALSYPLFLLVVCFISIGFATYLLLPQLKIIALSSNELPVTTEFFLVLISLSPWQWFLMFTVITLLLGLLFYFRHTYFSHLCLLRMGVMGKVLLYQDLSCFAHHMSACMKIKLNIPQALKQSTGLFKNNALKHHSEKMVFAILQGKSLSYALQQHPHLPTTLAQTVDGVRGQAHLSDCFSKLATHFEALGKKNMQRIQPFIEPLLTLLIGLLLAVFIHAIILPLYDGSIV